MKLIIKIIKVCILAVFLLSAPRFGSWVANMFEYSSIDPDSAFMFISVRHTVQALWVLLVVFILSKQYKINFNLGMGKKAVGFDYLKRFMLYFSIYVLIAFIITIVTSGVQSFQYPLTIQNISGYLGFQLFLSGPSEELIFRAFAMSVFVFIIGKGRFNKHLSYANLFAAIVFAVAHMQISLSPFGVSYNTSQILLALGLGYVYGDCYEKSDSVIYPMLMHSFSNVLMVGVTIVLSYI